MYRNERILALIPARGGSKGLPQKNLLSLAGRPLIAHTIDAALTAGCCDAVVVSTDDKKIADTARAYGAAVPFIRPRELSGDTAKSEPVAIHAVNTLLAAGQEFDIVIFLQPTSPLRTARHIQTSIATFIDKNLVSLVSVHRAREHPLLMRTIASDGRLQAILPQPSDVRRQDFSELMIVNGAIYINRVTEILSGWRGNDNMYGFVMDEESGLDINTEADMTKARAILEVRSTLSRPDQPGT